MSVGSKGPRRTRLSHPGLQLNLLSDLNLLHTIEGGEHMPPKKSKKPTLPSPGLRSLSPLLFGFGWRNSELDRLFYDVGALTFEERVHVAGRGIGEGGVIVVPPRKSAIPIREFDSPRAFLDDLESESRADEVVDSYVIAGIGSSALGCAALARNVADHVGRSVAGIVSAFDIADVVTEALGGWFDLGRAEQLRDQLGEGLPALGLESELAVRGDVDDVLVGTEHATSSHGGAEQQQTYTPGNPDARALLWLLCDARAEVNLLVGHSKGNLAIANALSGHSNLRECSPGLRARRPRVVTIGAAVPMPMEFDDVHQFVGELDWFGRMNSRRGVTYRSIDGAWHHLNTQLPLHLSVEAVLQLVARSPIR